MKKGIVAIFVVAILVALVGCVYVPPRQPTIINDNGKEYPVYGVKYSIFSPADKILLIDGQEY
ncbi:MAG: hypothetical protein RR716_07415, partial [Christensenellaceae bacterium]